VVAATEIYREWSSSPRVAKTPPGNSSCHSPGMFPVPGLVVTDFVCSTFFRCNSNPTASYLSFTFSTKLAETDY